MDTIIGSRFLEVGTRRANEGEGRHVKIKVFSNRDLVNILIILNGGIVLTFNFRVNGSEGVELGSKIYEVVKERILDPGTKVALSF